jgi:hypothetical protein
MTQAQPGDVRILFAGKRKMQGRLSGTAQPVHFGDQFARDPLHPGHRLHEEPPIDQYRIAALRHPRPLSPAFNDVP